MIACRRYAPGWRSSRCRGSSRIRALVCWPPSRPRGGEGMIGRFLRLFLALFVCQVLILTLFLLFVGSALVSHGGGGGAPVVHPHSTLSIDISGELIEYATLPSVPFLNEPPASHVEIVEALDRAAHDA